MGGAAVPCSGGTAVAVFAGEVQAQAIPARNSRSAQVLIINRLNLEGFTSYERFSQDDDCDSRNSTLTWDGRLHGAPPFTLAGHGMHVGFYGPSTCGVHGN